MVCKLNKSLYGLKQSARCWNLSIDKFLKDSAYVQSDADPCIYSMSEKSRLMIISLYVDDLLLASNDLSLLNTENKALREKFEMEDQNGAHYCLGMAIKCESKKYILTVNQRSYLESIFLKFGMANCKPVATPLETGKKFQKLPDESEAVKKGEYQAVFGSLVYAAIATRSDLCMAVGALGKFMAHPRPEHWTGIKRVLRYVKGMLEHGLKLMPTMKVDCNSKDTPTPTGQERLTQKVYFRVFVTLGGAIISWRSKRQNVVALSSTEAEYVALTLATQEAIWLTRLLKSLGFQQSDVEMNEDN